MVTGPSNPQYPYVRANWKKVQPIRLEPSPRAGFIRTLIDSPDFHRPRRFAPGPFFAATSGPSADRCGPLFGDAAMALRGHVDAVRLPQTAAQRGEHIAVGL